MQVLNNVIEFYYLFWVKLLFCFLDQSGGQGVRETFQNITFCYVLIYLISAVAYYHETLLKPVRNDIKE